MGIRHVLCHFIILCVLITFLFSIMYYVVSDKTYPSKFCNPDLCDVDERHIGCHPPGFSLICIKPRTITFNTGMKRLIMNNHNELRNQLAIGNVTGLKSAVRIGTVGWNNDLAYLASVNTKGCEVHYDECRNTKDYRYVGQNIAQVQVEYKTINSDRIYAVVPYIINLWFAEYKAANQALMDVYNKGEGSNMQNFSNIVHERTIKIGCGMTTYFSFAKKLMVLFVCNYSFRPHPGLPIYTSGPSGTKCESGFNPSYLGLCANGEHIHSDLH